MGRTERHVVVVVLLVLAGLSAGALDAQVGEPPRYCVRAGATGSGDGSDWDNAFPALPKALERGAVYYVAAGQYPAYTFDDEVSGNKYITIRKATEADHGPAAKWKKQYGEKPATFKPLLFLKSYYIFDGVTGGGPGSWTTGHGFEIFHPDGGMMIRILDWRAAEISHIEIRHVNAHCPSIDVKGTAVGGTTGKYSNMTISHCYFHDLFGAPVHIINWHDFLFEYNCVARNKCTREWHSEAVSSRGCTKVVYRWNWWENIQGTGIIMHMSGDAADWEVYGNIFVDTGAAPAGFTGHGVVADNMNGSIKRVKIYNNTIVGITGISSAFRFFKGAGEIDTANNLWCGCEAGALMLGVEHDYDTYVQTTPPSPPGPHDKVLKSAPFVDRAKADFRLTQPTAPGRTLPPPYNKDMFGNIRGSDGVWDRGALEYTAPAPADQTAR